MVVITAENYNEFKALASAATADKLFQRDGVIAGIGWHVIACTANGQIVVRYMQGTKPPQFEADFPTNKKVRDFQLV